MARLALAACVLACGCDRSGDPDATAPLGADTPNGSSAAGDRPNVLLVTLDTTRADRLGCYGYPAAGTPAIDGLAAAGVRFDQAFCHVPLTLPSHVTLMAGVLPAAAGVRINGDPLVAAPAGTLAESFADRGYRTGAFVAAFPLDADFGLDRGFEVYDDDLGRDPSGGERLERPADEVTDAALAWLDGSDDGRPFFAWVHYYDPHWPYEPPAPWSERHDEPYDGEIAFTDAQLGRLLDRLDRTGRRDDTLIVVAGDHGEAFGEHGEVQHGLLLYDVTMRIPLVLSWPGRLPEAAVVTETVGLVDLLPTIASLLGWPAPEAAAGRPMPPLRAGDDAAEPRAVYGETESPRRAYGWSALRSLTTDRWKYIDAPAPELYDRREDPGEMRNLVEREPDVAAGLRDELDRIAAQSAAVLEGSASLDEATRRRLASLGYLGAGTSAADDDDGAPRRDPKDMVDVYREHALAVAALQRGRFAEVVARVEPLVARSPESDVLHATLARALLEVGRPADAEREYELSLRGQRTFPERLVGLGEARRRTGAPREAIDAFQEALVLEPELVEAHRGLGMAFAALGDLDRALEHCRAFVDLAPDAPNALVNLANVHILRDELEPALPLLARAVELEPTNRMAQTAYWQALLRAGRRDDALDAMEAAAEAMPEHEREFICALAWEAATGPAGERRSEEIVALATRCRDVDVRWARGWDVLAVAHAAAGDFPAAIAAAERGIELARAGNEMSLVREMERRLARFRTGRPWRRTP